MRIKYAHDAINPEEVVRFLFFTGQADGVFREIIKMKEVVKKAKELDIAVTAEELQEFADGYRVRRGLHSAEETLEMFETAGVSKADFRLFCESSVLVKAVRDRLADEDGVRAYFASHRSQFDVARISIAVVENENLANEIIMQVKEDGRDFHALARQFSVDEASKYSGGHVGLVTRDMLPVELATRVFNARAGDLIGPIRRGELFEVILVEATTKGQLNEEVKEAIRERIFRGWVTKYMEGGIKIES